MVVVVGGGPVSLLFFCFVWWCRDGVGGADKCDSIPTAAGVAISLPFMINHPSTDSRIVCHREEAGVLWVVIHLGGCLCYSGPCSSSLALVRDF
ncbi:transmembrane protein, putative [Medicago truncatula]|uniref:Transmembrane protein, putative n=1 Tax=Medicago truncatula TaxID=3880 RepID=A0A072V7W4_MEDTR|nr:transmembrane protein, putative [Medicago truncatula]